MLYLYIYSIMLPVFDNVLYLQNNFSVKRLIQDIRIDYIYLQLDFLLYREVLPILLLTFRHRASSI